MNRKPKSTTTAGLVVRLIMLVVMIAAVGYLGMSPSTLSKILEVLNGDAPVATQPAE